MKISENIKKQENIPAIYREMLRKRDSKLTIAQENLLKEMMNCQRDDIGLPWKEQLKELSGYRFDEDTLSVFNEPYELPENEIQEVFKEYLKRTDQIQKLMNEIIKLQAVR